MVYEDVRGGVFNVTGQVYNSKGVEVVKEYIRVVFITEIYHTVVYEVSLGIGKITVTFTSLTLILAC